MASTVVELTKDVWNEVLTNVTDTGQVFIIDLDDEPTGYFIALVDTGAAFVWEQTNGAGDEGVIVRFTQTTGNAFDYANGYISVLI